MNALIYDLELKSRVLIPGAANRDPNSLTTHWYIPGSVARGMFINRFQHSAGQSRAESALRELFFESDLRFLNAYPRVGISRERSLPTPLSWRRIKDKENEIINLSVYRETVEDFTLKKISEPFCYLYEIEEGDEEELAANLITPEDWFAQHIKRPAGTGAANQDSQIFRYHSLARGAVFVGCVLSEDQCRLKKIEDLLKTKPDFYIGKSHKVEYGHVRLQDSRIILDWSETGCSVEQEDTFQITLLSDALIRDPETGSYAFDLSPVVGAPHVEAYASSRMVGGYNRGWNLPLPQAQAISAGSVFVYPNQPDLRAKANSFLQTGIGERTAEGFGRIALNWHTVELIMPREIQEPLPRDQRDQFVFEPGSETSDGEIARRVVQRVFEARMAPILVEKTNAIEIKHAPSNSQLSRLYLVLEKALADYQTNGDQAGAIKQITEHLKSLKKPAREQLQQAKVGSDTLLSWISEKIESPHNIWRDLLGVDLNRLPQIGNISIDLEALALPYTIRYIDGALRLTIKKRGKEVNRG